MSEEDWWSALPYATAASAKASALPSAPPGIRGKAKTTPQDMKALSDASATAHAERANLRGYASTERAVRDMGTGPVKGRWLDAITPDGDGGFWDTVGGVLGIPFRAVVSDKTMEARARIKTASAQSALSGSQMMKGSSSDKDTALMREAGVAPEKTVNENLRILGQARTNSLAAQARALFTSSWIGKYGSISSTAPKGTTYEAALAKFERSVSAPKTKPRPAPPSLRRNTGQPLEIDMNGNPIR